MLRNRSLGQTEEIRYPFIIAVQHKLEVCHDREGTKALEPQ